MLMQVVRGVQCVDQAVMRRRCHQVEDLRNEVCRRVYHSWYKRKEGAS